MAGSLSVDDGIRNELLRLTWDEIPDFEMRARVATAFLESDGEILVLKRSRKEDQSFTWGVPGGKFDREKDVEITDTLARELIEELGVELSPDLFKQVATRYVRIPGWDYELNIYHARLDPRPEITLSDEHVEHRWVKLDGFLALPLLKGQGEAFALTYPSAVISAARKVVAAGKTVLK